MSLILYQHPFASFAQKALVAMYELDLDFEPRLVENEDSRAELSGLWPMAKMPVLVDEAAGLMIPESSPVIEYVDALSPDGPVLVSADPAEALQARIWDRFLDHYVAMPMQKIVTDSLRSDDDRDLVGVAEARETLDTAYGVMETQLAGRSWIAGDEFGLPDCGAGPALFYTHAIHRWDAGSHPGVSRYYRSLVERPSIARVIEEARPYRGVFPLPWPDDIDAS